jgi:hypothetical protein
MEIRSYRRVFDLERRIYRIDQLRLNPSGVPVRGVVYFLALLAGVLLAARLPGTGLLAGGIPWYGRDVVVPGLLAALLAVIRVDGRSFHLAARAVLRLRAHPRTLVGLRSRRARPRGASGWRWSPGEVVILPDGSDAQTRRFRYTGPGALLVTVAHERAAARGPLVWLGLREDLTVRATAGARPEHGEVIVLDRNARLRVR